MSDPLLDQNAQNTYVLLSIKHGPISGTAIWWGPNRCGYTPCFDQAGRYTKQEADEIVANNTGPHQSCHAVRERDVWTLSNRVQHDAVMALLEDDDE